MRVATTRERGIALIITLLTMVVVAGIGTLLFARTVNEMRHSRDDAAIVQTLLLARGGANLGGSLLASDIRNELNEIVNVRSSTTTCWSFGTGDCGDAAPTPNSVVADLTGANSVATQLQTEIDAILCDASLDEFGGDSEVTIRVFVTDSSCGEGLPEGVRLPEGRFVAGNARPANQDYAIPFVMVSEAARGEYKRNVVVQGEYRFTVGRLTFAQYALFTNVHTSTGGSDIWFTDRTLFDGPVHTNEYFRFYSTPWFGHKVTTAGCPDNRRGVRTNPSTGQLEEYCTSQTYGAYFYDSPTRLRTNLGPNPAYGRNPVNQPELTGGVDWQSEYIPLPSNSYEQDLEAQRAGLHYGAGVSLSDLQLWAADASGNPLTRNASGEWTPEATYQYFQASVQSCNRWDWRGRCTGYSTSTVTHRVDQSGLLQVQDGSGAWTTALNASGAPITDFNGVIFVDGSVERFGGPARTSSNNPATAAPAIAGFMQLTLATEGQVRITRDIKYEHPPCSSAPTRQRNGTVTPATCDDLDALNVFGLYTQSADILIGHNNSSSADNAPTDVTIHGVLMSSEGIVGVEDYDRGATRGSVNLIGGIIENNYGAFGTFDGRTGEEMTGYGRTFTYDQRMYSSVSPPYFPTIGLDRVKDVRVFSFGQREQVY